MCSENLRSAEALVREPGSLISLPEVCLKLRAVLNDPDHSRRQITEVIMHDPALTSRLLRIVNSAYFGLSTTVRDISHALAILGEHDLHNLVVVTSIVRSVGSSLSHSFDIAAFWKQSIFSAVLARNLAESLDSKAMEELFICGLLLNLGKLPLYYREPELYREVSRLSQERRCDDWMIERELLGFDHAAVGAELAKSWNFSETLIETIAHHHDAPASHQSLHCRIAGVAGRFCEFCEMEDAGDPAGFPPDLENTGIDEALLRQALQASAGASRQIYEAFFGQRHGT